MKPNTIVIMIATLLTTLIVNAAESQVTTETNKAPEQSTTSERQNHWQLNSKSAVKIKGVDLGEKACSQFQVRFDDILSYQINCEGFSTDQNLTLNNSNQHTVTRKKGYTTITKYGYLIKKPQISQLDQTTLRVPFVSQIIHINQNEKNELAFYLESFKVDEFGRIVQDQFIQVHGLAQLERKVSAHKVERRRANRKN